MYSSYFNKNKNKEECFRQLINFSQSVILKTLSMKNLFWVIVISLLIAWIVGYLVYGVMFGGAIHILVLLALVMAIMRVVSDKGPSE